jgi:hypothetical protein
VVGIVRTYLLAHRATALQAWRGALGSAASAERTVVGN